MGYLPSHSAIMKQVRREDVKRLTARNTVLLLDLTSWTFSYVYNVIRRSPKNVSTKKGNKTLPPELWDEICSWVRSDPRQRVNRLVYPVEMTSVQLDGKTTEPAVVCNVIDEWRRYGYIKNPLELRCFEKYLESPWYEPTKIEGQKPPPKCPFFNISKTVLPDQSFTIPIRELEVWNFLFWGIRAPEVIAWTEYGECKLCNPRRELCAHCLPEIFDKFTGGGSYMILGDAIISCPLCIGPAFAAYKAYHTLKRLGYMG